MEISHKSIIHILPLWILLSSIYGLPNRDERLVGLFNYVTFPNDICPGTGDIGGRSGVCWTKEECAELNGIADGGCASGYGVCCIFLPSCGATVTQNLTYLVQDVTSNPTSKVCAYTLCPVSESVNRIRLDFTTMVIAPPVIAAANGGVVVGSSAGDCVTDSFSVTAGGGGKSSPVICGTNTGQHVIVDTDGENCVTASFVYGGDSVERQYDIRILQYETNNEMGGPPGCLQFLLGTVAAPHGGTVTSFNFAGGAHLSNQNYDVCIRRAEGQCGICWSQSAATTANAGATAIASSSFGLSLSDMALLDRSQVGTDCTSDYVVIPNGEAAANVAQNPIAIGNAGRFCGRVLNPAASQLASAQVCSRVAPFKLSFVSDADEVIPAGAAAGASDTNEASTGAGATGIPGTLGFSLAFTQTPCA